VFATSDSDDFDCTPGLAALGLINLEDIEGMNEYKSITKPCKFNVS